jgi:hypothetical protein
MADIMPALHVGLPAENCEYFVVVLILRLLGTPLIGMLKLEMRAVATSNQALT